jgi:NAD(P)-dependent dehydrogenase (short-subunit alcohol dehydrogenase family)
MGERRTALVTGASSGIGEATAIELAREGWRVIGTGRDAARSAAAQAKIRAAAANDAEPAFLTGDFCRMADVKRVAGEIAALTDRIDVLINNAGGVRDQRYTTPDGLEATFAANHLAAFLLTRELLPLLKAAAASAPRDSVRVIAVSSSGHQACPGMNWGDLHFTRNFTTAGAYCQAKLANILFTRELNRRVLADGIVAQVMHPGRVNSNFASHGDASMQAYMATAECVTPDAPARTLVWMTAAPEAGSPGGRYFHDLREVPAAPQALDDAAAARLWTESEKVLSALGF